MQAMCTENAARFDDRGDPARYLTLVVTELRRDERCHQMAAQPS